MPRLSIKSLFLTGAVGVLAMGGVARAAPHSITEMIKEYDLNGDRKVTRDEFDAVRKVRFLTTDTDGNGTLSEDEYVAEFQSRIDGELAGITDPAERKEQYDREMAQAHVRFGVLDTDHNGKMTFDEYQVSGHGMFDRQDLDHDDMVTGADSDRLKAQEKAGTGDDFISP